MKRAASMAAIQRTLADPYAALKGGTLDATAQRRMLAFLDALAQHWIAERQMPPPEIVAEWAAAKSALLNLGRRGLHPMKPERLEKLLAFMLDEQDKGTSRTQAAELAAERFDLSARRVLQLFPDRRAD